LAAAQWFFLRTSAGAGREELAMSGVSGMAVPRGPLQVVNRGRPAFGKWAYFELGQIGSVSDFNVKAAFQV
jgi:hypothetical protein